MIQKASIVLERLPVVCPPANTAYYILVTESVIVVATNSLRAFDNVSVVASGIIVPSVIQNTSIAAE